MTGKQKIMRVFGILLLVACGTGLLLLTAFNADRQDASACIDVQIHVDEERGIYFLDANDIRTILATEYGDSVKGDALGSIRVGRIETLLERNPYVDDAETWVDATGKLHIEIVQKQPIARVINKYGVNYYINNIGNKIPISDKFTARVPVVTGSIEEGIHNADMATTPALQNILKITRFINADPFWSAQIEQIAVANDGTFTLIPKLGDHKILFGGIAHMEEKFRKMQVFYTEGLNHTGWNTYSAFQLDFEGQIVCEKNKNYEQQ